MPFKEPVQDTEARPQGEDGVNWTTFRLRPPAHRLPADVKGIRPPFERVWRYGDQPLLEFPPSIANGVLYFVDNDGHARALSAKNGPEDLAAEDRRV